jgi:hypothetical protein
VLTRILTSLLDLGEVDQALGDEKLVPNASFRLSRLQELLLKSDEKRSESAKLIS